MNKKWSEKCKSTLELLGKAATFEEGKQSLLELREMLFAEITRIVGVCPPSEFSKRPFPKATGYHNETLSFCIWHVFRIEDMVCNTLIQGKKQVFDLDDWQKKINSPIITTANELNDDEFVTFSEKLNVQELYNYAKAVKESTDKYISAADYKTAKAKITEENRKLLEQSGGVSDAPDSIWLIDYWCGKNAIGLMKMPFSRHWIMHIEAMNRIMTKLNY